jgi:hypothetical protein
MFRPEAEPKFDHGKAGLIPVKIEKASLLYPILRNNPLKNLFL